MDHKRKRRQEKVRRPKHHERARWTQTQKQEAEPPEYDEDVEIASGPSPPLRLRYTSERMHRAMGRLARAQKIETDEDYRQFMNSLIGQDLDAMVNSLEDDPIEEAQELAFQAMEAEGPREALALAQQALALDPDCVDALSVAAGMTARSLKEVIPKMQQAVEAGERALGEDFFEENRGHFWGITETRPYMRARVALAQLLQRIGHTDEAVRHYEGMLELNPGDNQGVRDTLLGCYLVMDDLEGAQRLLQQYKDDFSAVFIWGEVLQRFLGGEIKKATKSLKKARERNPYVEDYLSGNKQRPRNLPDHYSPGEKSEAIYCAQELGPAWESHPEAVAWLNAER